MSSAPSRYIALLLLCAAMAVPLRSQQTPAGKQSAGKTSGAEKKPIPTLMQGTESKKPSEKKFDLSSLPPEAILVPSESIDDILNLMPNAVILSPGKYQELREEIERLKKLLQSEKPATPTRCDLRGKMEAGVVRLEAEFAGTTDRADTTVTLACPQAGASSAQTDGRMALIRRSEAGGFLVQIEKPGEYHVKLDLVLPLATREGNRRGFELTLPRAAITNVELDLPSNAKDVRVGGRTLSDADLAGLTLKNHHLAGNPGLGPVDKLDLAWREERPASGTPLLTAEGRIQVRFDAGRQTTVADMLLKVEGAPTDAWRLLVPLGAEVKVLPPDDARVKSGIDTANQKFAALRTIHLKEPSSEPLHVQIKISGPLPQGNAAMPVGPFFVLGAARQTGTVVVRNQTRHLHLDYRTHGDMQLDRARADEQRAEASTTTMAFVYSNIPLIEKPQAFTGANSLSWLDLEAEIVHPQLRTRVSHVLMLRPDPMRDSLHWEILTTITPATKWTDVEQLKVFVPPGWISTEDGIAVLSGSNPPCVMLPSSALRDSPSQPVRLLGRYEALYRQEGRVVLKLPRPQGLVEQCDVRIEVPRDAELALHNAEQSDLELIKQTRPNEQTWRCRSLGALTQPRSTDLADIDVSWRPYRPEVRVKSVVDLTLHGNLGEVRHKLRVQLPPSPPAALQLRVPAAIGNLQLDKEASSTAPDAIALIQGVAQLPIPSKAAGTEWLLVLRYSTRLNDPKPQSGEPFLVPLVVPEQVTSGETKVRIWSEPASLPRPAVNPNWEERRIEEVKDRPELPVLVLYSARFDAPLLLRVGEQDAGFSVLVERSLMRVRLLEGGGQSWHVRYVLRQLAGQALDILLPDSVPVLNVRFFLNRREVTPQIVRTTGEHPSNLARLHLSPELIRPMALLEVSFSSPPGRTGVSPLRTTLHPPQLRGAPTAAPSRWIVSIPANRVLITPENALGMERTWTRQGWLLSAHLQRSAADLEREFEEPLPVELRSDSEHLNGEASLTPALVCWQDDAAPLHLTYAPQQGWLLVCSLSLLILGLGLYWSSRPRADDAGRMAFWFWPLLAILTLAAALAALFWPTTFWAIVYGCEPGVLGILSVLAFQWLLHRRYRRQIVFLPSFSRSRPGSSLIRNSSAKRPQNGEPSTVDAPPKGAAG